MVLIYLYRLYIGYSPKEVPTISFSGCHAVLIYLGVSLPTPILSSIPSNELIDEVAAKGSSYVVNYETEPSNKQLNISLMICLSCT